MPKLIKLKKMEDSTMKTETTINTNTHINRLDAKIQRKIAYQLRCAGLFEEDIQMLMGGKIRDIEEVFA